MKIIDKLNLFIFVRNLFTTRKKLTYEQRIKWFLNNYYETGMEYEGMFYAMKNVDLDNFKWYDESIKIPKYKDELTKK